MCSELFRIPMQFAGVPLFGFGVLLVLWLIAAGVGAWRMSRTPEGKAEITSLLPVFAVVTGLIIFLPRFLSEGIPVRGYGVMLVLAASTGLAMAVHRARKLGLDADSVLSMAFGMFVLGIIGARLFFVVEYWDVMFAGQGLGGALKKAVMFTEGGLVVYGSLVGGVIAFALFCWWRKLSVPAMADVLAPSLAVGLAIGRIGCLMNGCCFGGQSDAPWAIEFPRMSSPEQMSPPYARQLTSGRFHGFLWEEDPSNGSLVVTELDDQAAPAGLAVGDTITSINGVELESAVALGQSIIGLYDSKRELRLGLADGETVVIPPAALRDTSLPVHPTQLYSAVNAGLLGWFLWLYYPHRRRDGEVALLLLTIYPVGRFLLEDIRIDESSFFGTGLSISQNVSIAILLLMAPAWLYLRSRPAGRTESLVPA